MSQDETPEAAQRRNEVFQRMESKIGNQPQVPPIQQNAAAASILNEFGLDVAIDSVPLPSNGKIYPESSPLHNVTQVDIRAMTAKEEDILTSRALAKNGTVITRLLQSCLVDKRIDVGSMISGDRNAIMTAIRITGYGRIYKVDVQCPDCDEKSEFAFDLAQLPVKRLSLDPVRPGENLFEFVLPQSKATVHWRFMTGRDEEELTQVASAKKKAKLNNDNLVTSRLTKMIVSVNGKEDRNKIAQLVPILPAVDTSAFRKHVQDNEPGIEMVGMFTCSECGESSEVDVPFGMNFFWPNSKRS